MNETRIVFRTKASATIGFGHARRCLTLAKVLRSQQTEVYFIINSDEQFIHILKGNGFLYVTVDDVDQGNLQQTLTYLQKWQASVIVIDSYEISYQAYEALNKFPIVVIDDRTELIVPVNFNIVRKFHQPIERILITVGGGDKTELTLQWIAWVREILPVNLILDVVIGPFFSNELKNKLKEMTKEDKLLALHYAPNTLFELMKQCDIALTGGGQTTFELAVMGVPTVAICLIDNQTINLNYLVKQGTLLWAGNILDGNLSEKVKVALSRLADHPEERKELSERGPTVVDGMGAKRVAKEILSICGRRL